MTQPAVIWKEGAPVKVGGESEDMEVSFLLADKNFHAQQLLTLPESARLTRMSSVARIKSIDERLAQLASAKRSDGMTSTERPVWLAQINVLWCPKGIGAECFSEKTFKGTPDAVGGQVLRCIQDNYLNQMVIKHPDRAQATRVWNFPLAAIKAALAYALDHLPCNTQVPMVVRVGYHELTIKSCFELDSPTHLTNGRSADILQAMTAKGYPAPLLEIDQNNVSLLIRLPAHALVQEPFPQVVRNGPP